MNSSPTEMRRFSRVQLPIPAEVSCVSLRSFRQPAHLRNISACGAFFFAQLNPNVGTSVKLDFTVKANGAEIQIACEGPIVRVEPQALGEQSGIAIEFSRLNLGSW